MRPKLMERAPGFIGTAGVPLVRQANISFMAEFVPAVLLCKVNQRGPFALITYSPPAADRKLCAHGG
jgi:hypothetical protein